MTRTIFYAWQATLANATNRGLIHRALTDACAVVGRDFGIDERPEIDHDTRGVPGSPDIVSTIHRKIRAAECFVGDVSIVHPGEDPAPNANVLYELGLADGLLGPERVLLVMNVASGAHDCLPFDLRNRRVIGYRAAEGGENTQERRRLQRIFEESFRAVLSQQSKADGELARALQVILVEAERMREHAHNLNIELHYGRDTYYLPLGFRTAQLETVLPQVAHLLSSNDSLRMNFTNLRTIAAAVDDETRRLMARGGDARRLRNMVINVNHAAASVLRDVEPLLRRAQAPTN